MKLTDLLQQLLAGDFEARVPEYPEGRFVVLDTCGPDCNCQLSRCLYDTHEAVGAYNKFGMCPAEEGMPDQRHRTQEHIDELIALVPLVDEWAWHIREDGLVVNTMGESVFSVIANDLVGARNAMGERWKDNDFAAIQALYGTPLTDRQILAAKTLQLTLQEGKECVFFKAGILDLVEA